jgi:hypothetical protein
MQTVGTITTICPISVLDGGLYGCHQQSDMNSSARCFLPTWKGHNSRRYMQALPLPCFDTYSSMAMPAAAGHCGCASFTWMYHSLKRLLQLRFHVISADVAYNWGLAWSFSIEFCGKLIIMRTNSATRLKILQPIENWFLQNNTPTLGTKQQNWSQNKFS